MKWIRWLTTAALLLFVAASLGLATVDAFGLRAGPVTSGEDLTPQTAKAPVVAYYFHSNLRCTMCRDIEANGQAALAEAVRDGRVEWRVVNYDEPANKHFARDYELAFASLVLVASDGSSTPRWKTLELVWELHNKPAAFAEYVQRELADFMKGQS